MLVEWHVTQGLANSLAVARRDELGIQGTPLVWFDGVDSYLSSASAYTNYRARLETRLAVGSPISIDAELEVDAGASSGEVRATITLAPGEIVSNPGEHLVRIALFEDGVSYCCDPNGGSTFQHVGRILTPGEALTVTGGAPVQGITWPFVIQPGWVAANLRAAVLVEQAASNDILNAARATRVDPSSVRDSSWGRLKSAFR